MDNSQKLYQKVKELHNTYGGSIPGSAFTDDVYNLLIEFKEIWININWLDAEVIWALANIDRHNGYNY